MATVWKHGRRFATRFRLQGQAYTTTFHREVDRSMAEWMAEQASEWLKNGEPWESVKRWLRQRPIAHETSEEFESLIPYFQASIAEAKKRAAKKGVPFDLDPADAEELLGDGTCYLTGIPFSLELHGGSARRPFAPSLDRVEAARGYVRDNVRAVCVAVNLALNEWGEEVFAQVAQRYIAKRVYKNPDL